jgi:protease-4
MRRFWIVFLIVLGVFLLAAYGVFFVWLIGRGTRALPSTGSIAIVRIEGVISASGAEGGIFGTAGPYPEDVIFQLKKAEKDFAVKAVLLRVNSPGGTAAASQEIYREVRKMKKPVIASVGDVSASGAYYIASAADEIVASPASEVGSIGVILQLPNLEGLLDKLGVKYVFITRGKYKDIGNPTRPLQPEEREILEDQAEAVYEQFILDVARARNLPVDRVRELATGLTYLGTEALELRLIDRLGNFQDAIDLAAKMGKIKGEPGVVEYGAPSLLDLVRNLIRTRSSGFDQLLIRNLRSLPLQPQIPK